MLLLSLAPSNTEILYALGVGDQIVGVTEFCDYPEEAKSKPKLGGWTTPIVDRIIQLSPDFIFTSIFLPSELKNWPASLSLKRLASTLERGEKGPGEIIHVTPKTISQIYQSIKYIGKKILKEKETEEIISKMKQGFDEIKKAAPKRKPRVYMEEWPVPPMTSGNWVPELVEIAGGVSFARKGRPSGEFTFKDLAEFDPDVMIFHWCNYGTRFDKKIVLKREGWDTLEAVRKNKFFVINDSLLNRPGPRLVQGVRKLQQIIKNL